MGFIMLPRLIYKHHNTPSRRKILVYFTILILWAFVSLLWSDTPSVGIHSLFYVLAISWFAMASSYVVSYLFVDNGIKWEGIITRIAFFLTAVFVVYTFMYVFGSVSSYGGVRLRGPLGGAAVIHVIMLPVLAVHIANIKRRSNPVTLSWIAALLTIGEIFLTGSRAGVATMLIMVILLFIKRGTIKTYVILILSASIIFFSLNMLMDFERFTNFEDSKRQLTHQTSLQIATQSTSNFLFGQGYSALWPWYLYTESMRGSSNVENMVYTHYGFILYHPHSVFLQLLVELGAVSFIPFLIILANIIKKLRNIKDTMRKFILMAILCTLPSFLADLYLFNNWQVSMVWWLFVFAGVAAPKSPE